MLYREDNAVLEVEFIKNRSTDKEIVIDLRVIRTITPHAIGGHANPGSVFTASCRRDMFGYFWTIAEDDNTAPLVSFILKVCQ